jgi:hypothetical protein
MQLTARRSKIVVSADGCGIVSQAGRLLLPRALEVTGLGRGLDAALEPWRHARAVQQPWEDRHRSGGGAGAGRGLPGGRDDAAGPAGAVRVVELAKANRTRLAPG